MPFLIGLNLSDFNFISTFSPLFVEFIYTISPSLSPLPIYFLSPPPLPPCNQTKVIGQYLQQTTTTPLPPTNKTHSTSPPPSATVKSVKTYPFHLHALTCWMIWLGEIVIGTPKDFKWHNGFKSRSSTEQWLDSPKDYNSMTRIIRFQKGLCVLVPVFGTDVSKWCILVT